MASIRSSCQRAYIIAHREDVGQLRAALEVDGFVVVEVRGPYTQEQLGYSMAMRCLVNHANAWKFIAEGNAPAIVVEADFVPVRGFGALPLPFRYAGGRDDSNFGWLYSGGSILYGFDGEGYPHGYGNTTVAYALTPAAAQRLAIFFEREIAADPSGGYRQWETYLGIYLRWEAGTLNHIPIYQYGEHGGIQNREHQVAGVRGWHQADTLWGRLAFLPAYAKGSVLRFRMVRLRGWMRGLARLATLRYFDPRHINADSSRGRLSMAAFAISRTFRLARTHVTRIHG